MAINCHKDAMDHPRFLCSSLARAELMKPIAINVHMIQGQSINYATQIAARKIRKLLDKRSGFFNK